MEEDELRKKTETAPQNAKLQPAAATASTEPQPLRPLSEKK